MVCVVAGSVQFSVPSVSSSAAVVYMSPTGADSNNGLSASAPFKTFARAFSTLSAGGTLYLMDGTYTASANGSMDKNLASPSAVPPDGVSPTQMTTIMALNDGGVVVGSTMGRGLMLGTTSVAKRYIKFQGFTITGGVDLYHVDHIFFKNMGVTDTGGGNSVFGIGSNDNGGTMVSSYVTLEDCWLWGKARKIFGPLNSDHVSLRRVVMRNDGCASSSEYCGSNSGNYMSASTVYNSSHISLQNVLAVDNVLGPGGFAGGADFWTAWHTSAGTHPFGANEWLGSISLNSEYSGFKTETDDEPGLINPVVTYKNNVAWNAAGTAFGAQCRHCSSQTAIWANLTAYGSTMSFDVFNMYYASDSTVVNLVALGQGRYGYNGIVAPSYVDNAVSPAYNDSECQAGCKTSNAISDGSIKHIARIETGSPLKGTGSGGADYGANVVTRYGTDGTFYGDANFNTLTTVPLWPWSNQSRIKSEMCAGTGVTRGFCSSPSLTDYIWSHLGNPNPYGGSAPHPAPSNVRIVR